MQPILTQKFCKSFYLKHVSRFTFKVTLNHYKQFSWLKSIKKYFGLIVLYFTTSLWVTWDLLFQSICIFTVSDYSWLDLCSDNIGFHWSNQEDLNASSQATENFGKGSLRHFKPINICLHTKPFNVYYLVVYSRNFSFHRLEQKLSLYLITVTSGMLHKLNVFDKSIMLPKKAWSPHVTLR